MLWTAAIFLALSPIALGPVSLNTYDAWPALLTVAAVALLVADRAKTRARRCSGSAAAAKLYAVLLVPVAFVWLWRERGRRVALGPLAPSLAAVAVLVVPWLALSPGGVWDSFHSQVGRGLHTESLGAGFLLVADRLGWYHAHVVSTAPAISRDLAGGLPRASRRGAPRSPSSPRSCRRSCSCFGAPGRGSRSLPASPGFSRSRRCSRRSTSSG